MALLIKRLKRRLHLIFFLCMQIIQELYIPILQILEALVWPLVVVVHVAWLISSAGIFFFGCVHP
jgi:hypothetical protein